MGSADVRVFGLVSGQTIIGEVDPGGSVIGVAGGLSYVLHYPGLLQLFQAPGGSGGVSVSLIPVAYKELIDDFADFMSRFLLPRDTILYEAKASTAGVNMYFKYRNSLREQLSGIKVVRQIPGGGPGGLMH